MSVSIIERSFNGILLVINCKQNIYKTVKNLNNTHFLDLFIFTISQLSF